MGGVGAKDSASFNPGAPPAVPFGEAITMFKLRSAVALVTVTMGSTAAAAIINVPADFPTIQAAIDAAVDGDEIVAATGTYTRPSCLPGRR